MAHNQEHQVVHETDARDRQEALKSLSGNQPALAVSTRDWGNLTRIPEDKRVVMTLLHKRQLAFDGPESQQPARKGARDTRPSKEKGTADP